MNGKRIGLILIIVAALLFVVAVIVGPSEGTADPREHPWIKGAGSLLSRKVPVRAKDVSGGCLDDRVITLPAMGVCELTVAASDSTVRSLRLEIERGVDVRIVASQGGDRSFPAKERLPNKDGRTVKLDIFRDGATVTLMNVSTEPARVRIG